MFKNRYQDVNAQIQAPENAFARLGLKNNRPRRMAAIQIFAACLAVFVLATAAVTMLHPGKTNVTDRQVTAQAVTDYDQLYDFIASAQAGGSRTNGRDEFTIEDKASAPQAGDSLAAPAPNAPEATQGTTGTGADKSHSNTNVQVNGVDEADIVKTDGNYIYRLLDNEIAIVKVDGEKMEVVSRIKIGKSGESPMAVEMFINKDRLLVISQENQWILFDAKPEGSGIVPPQGNNESKTYATVYDITDRTSPKKLDQFSQSGGYLSARMVKDTVYLISNYYVYNMLKGQPETYVPSVTAGGETKLIKPENIQVFENPNTPAYVIATAINIDEAKQHNSVKAVLGSAGTVYADSDSLLVAANQYESNKSPIQKDANGKNVITVTDTQKTKLLLFKIDGGTITEKASATIPGMLHNQFSMDEYNGVFRIVTTVNTSVTRIYTDGEDTYEYEGKSANSLFTLDQNLKTLGSVEDLAKDESIYSVRFDGPVGYFVTFRQVDPLFAVDLSDPASPKILSQLKIPGFSDYLHVYSDGLLFGFGQNTVEKDNSTGQKSVTVDGLKLSMFNVKDPKNVTEVHTKKLDTHWSDASYNHKAILVDAERSLIAFPAEGKYYVYGYNKDSGFFEKAKLDLGQNGWDGSLRGLFIENNFYVCSAEKIVAYSLSDFKKLSTVKLK